MAVSPNLGEFPNFEICNFSKFGENLQIWMSPDCRYATLKSDLEQNGYKCFLVPFEVGSRGYIQRSTKSNIFNIFATMKISANHKHCIQNMSKISLLASYTIFHAYTQPTWRNPPFLTT